jgi:hypothetical protein
VAVSVTPSDGTASGTAAGASATVANSAPTLASASIAETTATTSTLLHAIAGATADGDNDVIALAYQWTRNGADIVGATTQALDLSVAGNGDKATSFASGSRLLTAPSTAPSRHHRPDDRELGAVTTVALAPSSPDTNALVTATATRADSDGDAVALTFVWRVNGP